jgi:archaellum component FlaG (FlaF/FlaG flagellin family)
MTTQVIDSTQSPPAQNGSDKIGGENTDIKPAPDKRERANSASQGTENKEHSKPIMIPEWVSPIFAGVAALAAIILAVISHNANCIAEQAVSDARKQVRAQVVISDGQTIWGVGKANLTLTIKNAGATQSNETTITFGRLECGHYPPLNGTLEIADNIPATLANGQSFVLHKTISVPDFSAIKAGTMAVYASGTIRYRDVFGETQSETFSLIQGGRYKWDANSMGVYDGRSNR